MKSISRRGFLSRVGSMALVPLMAEEPQTILYNGNIITVDSSQPRAQALAVAGGRFIAVGTNREIRALANARTRAIDLEGKTVTPGFIDAHSHPASAGRRHLTRVDCDLRSIAEIKEAIRARAAITPAGEWVLGFKYDDTKTREGRFLSRDDLDAAAPGHPVFIVHRGGHSQYVNSLAYSKAGVTEDTPDPSGGRFVRNPDSGRLNGRILERAEEAFSAVIPEGYDRKDYQAGVKLISEMLARAGITSVHDAYTSSLDLQAYQDAREAGELLTRLYCLMDSDQIDDMIDAGVRTGFGDEWVRIGAMKATCDGLISGLVWGQSQFTSAGFKRSQALNNQRPPRILSNSNRSKIFTTPFWSQSLAGVDSRLPESTFSKSSRSKMFTIPLPETSPIKKDPTISS